MDDDRRYCVYLHKSLDGEVFYVGSGTVDRARTKEMSPTKGKGTCRGKKYSEKVNELGFVYDVEIVDSCLTKEESYEIEKIYIDRFKLTIVNTNNPVKETDLSALDGVFVYNENSPSFLSWGIDYLRAKVGDPVRYNDSRGYMIVKYMRKRYSVHRVVAYLFGLDIVGKVVDHKDGNPHNNNISNLRVVTQRENRRNSRMRCDNTTGYSGIRFVEHKNHWIFNWYENSRRNTKTFHLRNYENDKQAALQAALEFRYEKLKDLDYTESHGI